MKVVALVSGGKDSCHAMYLATREGHEVVALANLLPQELQPDELDSYMFQTVRAMCWLVMMISMRGRARRKRGDWLGWVMHVIDA